MRKVVLTTITYKSHAHQGIDQFLTPFCLSISTASGKNKLAITNNATVTALQIDFLPANYSYVEKVKLYLRSCLASRGSRSAKIFLDNDLLCLYLKSAFGSKLVKLI